ncbi:hypothetical protein DY000_02043705 [Brassica cretica]|uniref:Uncharacterized protein n=1 Tax=Brassica cretica TaxID=69181 RepID=A0ABQ7BNR9_BRACR|nr:hypothetical protein DY000_02043704 [Brassica cretica]KAF3534369.1 hypothetical protein DY000_02043705 [Brassica cretica]
MEPRAGASPKGKVFTGTKSRKLRREYRKTLEPKASHITQRVPSCAGTGAHQRAATPEEDSVKTGA